jgi:NADH-quinone oxidoreductase subunit K
VVPLGGAGVFQVVPLSWYVVLGGAVFCIGILGFLTRRNVIIMLMSIELMLNGVNITLVAFNHYLQDMRGQILALFIITVAAAEVAVGLALIIALFKNKQTVNVDELDIMKW